MKNLKKAPKEKKKIHFFSLPSAKISIIYYAISTISIIAISLVIPLILNYPPDSINTPFDIQMSGIAYVWQFTLIDILALFAIYFFMRFLFKPIDNWFIHKDNPKYSSQKNIDIIRKKCINLPYIVFIVELIVPGIVSLIILTLTGSHESTMIIKLSVIIVSFSCLFAVSSYMFSKNIFAKLLAETYKDNSNIGLRISLNIKLLMQILPICIIGLLGMGLIGYSKSIKSAEDTWFTVYNNELNNVFDTNEIYTYERISNLLQKVNLYHDKDSVSTFILSEDGKVDTISGKKPSNFVIEYTLQLSEKNNNKTYDSYAVDTQGATIKVHTKSKSYYVCILYDTNVKESLKYITYTFIILLIIITAILITIINSISKDISAVSDRLSHISNNEEVDKFTTIPVISNDEIGDLSKSYNSIQKMNKENLQKIKNSQDLLIEHERLASLGQMIGGIAHNLKTPIMSVSGASEGLSDLIKELDMSIGNKNVTEEDFHDIASDMNEWINKIRTHTSYMSDVITAVKGQAIVFSEEQVYPFNSKELFKQVEILMKHELKNSITRLNIKDYTTEDDLIYGNINSLVQILNNMISNSIQAYSLIKHDKETTINLTSKIEKNKIIINIQDFGPGLPDNVKEKLFKEMITTKGKEGTGLGLFMSYSNIKAHFHGEITFETSSKGTTFNIILPIHKS
ncbi:MAG: HAMP domain-containing histidine kinase [Clostridia bacterium]|nr:HAMP domain-containing histidine kinase [Clostridia bacterium]